MELLRPNFINTTTMIAVDSNTVTAGFIFNPDPSFQYVSNGYANDLTTTLLRIQFQETVTVSRIALIGHNLKAFDLFYNGVTANVMPLTATCGTVAAAFTQNSATSIYLTCNPTFCTSLTLAMKKTIAADVEKALGYFVVSQEEIQFPRPPSAKNYKPVVSPTDVVHKLSDGGIRIQVVTNKRSVGLKYQYLTESFRDQLKAIHEAHMEHVFVGFGTTTGWDGLLFPCVWEGDFEFYQFSDEAVGAGFSGSIQLRETPA